MTCTDLGNPNQPGQLASISSQTTVTTTTSGNHICAGIASLTSSAGLEVNVGYSTTLTGASTDGTSPLSWSGSVTATGPSVTFTCTTTGQFPITLSVTDPFVGCTASSLTSTVQCTNPSVDGTGGAPATGGSPATGGANSTGGAPAAGGAATGGTPATGGAATGGALATGGGSSLAACSVDNVASDTNFYSTTTFCTPSSSALTLMTGTLSIGALQISGANGTISMTGTVPFVGDLAIEPPFNNPPLLGSERNGHWFQSASSLHGNYMDRNEQPSN